MNHAKKFVCAALTSLILTGCASSGSNVADAPATKETYKAAFNGAQMALSKAGKAQNEWRDSGKILIKAAKAAKTGDYKTATKLALQAKRQGELAYEQAQFEANAGPKP